MTRKRRLSEDDVNVWKQVARTANPLHPASRSAKPEPPAKSPQAALDGAHATPTAKKPARIPEFRVGQTAGLDQSKSHNLGPTLEGRLSGQPVRMDYKTFGKMKKGKLRPERKIDLHGMTLAKAHPVLSRFIISAAADGCRLVLVVTGKGKQRSDDGPIPTPRGVLRNQVPTWLQMAPLGSLVLQVTAAHASHGGSGAYYVYLTRRR